MKRHLLLPWSAGLATLGIAGGLYLQQANAQQPAPKGRTLPDAVQDAQLPREVERKRPEQKLSEHDRSEVFQAPNAPHSSRELPKQPEKGEINGFDFVRDPLNAKKPMQSPDEIKAADKEAKAGVMAAQKALLEKRYDLTPKLDPAVKMSRGKPVPVGPTARLAKDLTFEELAKLPPEQIKKDGTFPYPPLPHPKHVAGGQLFPPAQLEMFPRLHALRSSISICRRRSSRSFRRRSSCRTGRSSAMCRAARWFRSITSTGFSRTSSRRCSWMACACC